MEEKLNFENIESNSSKNIKIHTPSVSIDSSTFSKYGLVQSVESNTKDSVNNSSAINAVSSGNISGASTKIHTPRISFDISYTLESGLMSSDKKDPNAKSMIIYGNNYDDTNPRKMGNVYTYCFKNNEPLIVIGPNCKITLLNL